MGCRLAERSGRNGRGRDYADTAATRALASALLRSGEGALLVGRRDRRLRQA